MRLTYPFISNTGKHPVSAHPWAPVQRSATAWWMWGLAHWTSYNQTSWYFVSLAGVLRPSVRGIIEKTEPVRWFSTGHKRLNCQLCSFLFYHTLHTQPLVQTKRTTNTNCNPVTTAPAHSRSVLWWYRSSCFGALCNILQGTVVPLMGKGQTRLWKSLFTASCLAVWSRSQQLLKWNEPRSHRLIRFFWMLAGLQWHRRERHKHSVSSPP